jgi:hypothetical protein
MCAVGRSRARISSTEPDLQSSTRPNSLVAPDRPLSRQFAGASSGSFQVPAGNYSAPTVAGTEQDPQGQRTRRCSGEGSLGREHSGSIGIAGDVVNRLANDTEWASPSRQCPFSHSNGEYILHRGVHYRRDRYRVDYSSPNAAPATPSALCFRTNAVTLGDCSDPIGCCIVRRVSGRPSAFTSVT